MVMVMNETPAKDIGNYSDESTAISDSSGGTGGSFSPPLKRLCKASTDSTTTTAADDTHSKTLSTRSSISEEFGGPHLLQPSDPLQRTLLMKSSISEEFGGPYPLQPSDPEQQTAVRSDLDSQTEIENWRVDPEWLYCYADQALDYVEHMKGEEYIYLGPRSMCLCSVPESEYKVTHINFFARRRGEQQESLLFAALEHRPIRKVLECCTVPLLTAGDYDVPCIKHPVHVDCLECSKFGEAALCYDVEEESCCMSWSCS